MTIQSQLLKSIIANPNKTAIKYGGLRLSYQELYDAALIIANDLSTRNLQHSSIALIYNDKLHLVIAMLGVLFSRNIFVPIPPKTPQSRIKKILELSKAKLILSDTEVFTGNVLKTFNSVKLLLANTHSNFKPLIGDPDDLSHIYFTSGSTGEPKGIKGRNASLLSFMQWMNNHFAINSNDVVMQLAGEGFSLFKREVLATFMAGATLCIPSELDKSSFESIAEFMAQNKITLLNIVPSYANYLVNYLDKDQHSSLRVLFFAGEILHKSLINKYLKIFAKQCRIVNLYGPTETTQAKFYYEINPDNIDFKDITPVAWPINQVTQAKIRDDAGNISSEAFVKGEVLIQTADMSYGYCNESQNTPFIELDGHKVFCTGDLGYKDDLGRLYILGRNDSQIKIRGMRVELSEIEATISSFTGVNEVAVLFKQSGEGSEGQLIAFISGDISQDVLKSSLSLSLPDYMLPNYYIYLPTLPKNRNNKTDRLVLDNLPLENTVIQKSQVTTGSISDDVTIKLITIWQQVLQPGFSINDDFFALGGSSLLVMSIAAQIHKQFKLQLSLNIFYEKRTIAELAAYIKRSQGVSSTDRGFKLEQGEYTDNRFGLSHIQQAYVLGRFGDYQLGNIATQRYIEYKFEQALDITKLEFAINSLIARHEMLRTSFTLDEMLHVIHPAFKYKLELNDYTKSKSFSAEVLQVRATMLASQFDIAQLPLFSISISRGIEGDVLHFLSDILIMDANSLNIFRDELTALYQGRDLSPIKYTFRDYITAKSRTQATDNYHSQFYWKSRFKQLPNILPLTTKVNPEAINIPVFARDTQEIDVDTWSAFKQQAYKNQLSPSSALLTIYYYVLNRYADNPNFLINISIFDQSGDINEHGNIIGDFTDLLLFSPHTKTAGEFAQLVEKNHALLWCDLEHRAIDGLEVSSIIKQKFNLDTQAIIAPIVFTSLLERNDDNQFFLAKSHEEFYLSQTAQVWLDNNALETKGKLVSGWDYVTQLFDAKYIYRLHSIYIGLIKYFATQAWDSLIPDICPKADLELIHAANSASIDLTKLTTLKQQAILRPEAIAVIDSQGSTSYGSLLEKSYSLASVLRQQNVQKGELVAILSEKGYQQVVAAWGIMKIGAAYLPLHIDWPLGRVDEVLQNGKVKLLVVSRKQLSKIQDSLIFANYQIIVIEDAEQEQYTGIAEIPMSDLNEMAYVLFTSGSTGKPKGVVISYLGAMNTLEAVNQRFAVGTSDVVLAVSELNFDLSVYDIFGILDAGGTVVFPDQERVKDPEHWYDLVKQYKVTIWNSVPQIMQLLVDYASSQNKMLDSLRAVLMSGDWIPLGLPRQIQMLSPSARIMSLGGATEGSIWSIWYEINQVDAKWKSIPYGTAMPNQKMYVLNADGEHCPIGVIGEIHIGGVGVALGYWNDEEKTKAAFVQHAKLGRLYKTGDFGKWNPDGYIEFLGRKDHQVKINGYRIELEEISAKLVRIAGIREAFTQIIQHEGIAYIISYLLLVKSKTFQLNTEKEHLNALLGEILPSYMLPHTYLILDEFPLTANAKVDIKQLPVPTLGVDEVSYTAPRSQKELQLTNLWASVLGLSIDKIGTQQSFFKLGGNSILLISLKAKLSQLDWCKSLSITDLFKYHTIHDLVAYIEDGEAVTLKMQQSSNSQSNEIAIIGLSGAFSGCDSVSQLWELISQQQEGLKTYNIDECRKLGVSDELLNNPDYIPVSGHVSHIDLFDPMFWGISGGEAKQTDPQIRKFLEHCYFALEQAGYSARRKEFNIGVFSGCGNNNSYHYEHILNGEEKDKINQWEASVANSRYALATWVSYLLGLTGPANAIDTACSTGLVTVVEACKNLLLGTCDMALAGGVSLVMPEHIGYVYQDGMIRSKDGHCRVFDQDSSGTIFGSGVGVVLLKRLDDAIAAKDNIIAVVKGYATNNDGDRKIAYAAPSVVGQTECILNAQKMAGITSDQIDYIECHGTATNLGDPVEISALKEAFTLNSATHSQRCILGGVKANIGHTNAGAGIAGLIKVCSMLQHNMIPGQANFAQLNPELHLESSNFKVISSNQEWISSSERPRIAGVSSFGIGGTNAHIIVSEFIQTAKEIIVADAQTYILPLCAKSRKSLEQYKHEFAAYLLAQGNANLNNIAYTLQHTREHHPYRLAITAKTALEAVAKLNMKLNINHVKDKKTFNLPNIVFMFPGQGSQYSNMARELYSNDTQFQTVFKQCVSIANQYLKRDLSEVIYPSTSDVQSDLINQTMWTQVSLFTLSYSLAKWLEQKGIHATSYIGHSIGEYVAATLSGVFSLEDAIKLVLVRGQLMQQMQAGSMLSIQQQLSQTQAIISQYNCELAVINSKDNYVVSGTEEDIQKLKSKLEQLDISSIILNTSHAYHSKMMDEAALKFAQEFSQIKLNPATKPFISNLSGKFANSQEVTQPSYWCKQLRNCVQFAQGVDTLCTHYPENLVFIEVGAGKGLSSFVTKDHAAISAISLLPSKVQAESGNYPTLSTIEDIGAILWSHGLEHDFTHYNQLIPQAVYDLPHYQFDSKAYWIKALVNSGQSSKLKLLGKPQWYNSLEWKKAFSLKSQVKKNQAFTMLLFISNADETPLPYELAQNILHLVLDSSCRNFVAQDNILRLNPVSEMGYKQLAKWLNQQLIGLDSIIHSASIMQDTILADSTTSLDFGFYALFLLKQFILSQIKIKNLIILTNGLSQITGADPIHPFNGAMVGAMRNIQHEFPDMQSLIIDISSNLVASYPAVATLLAKAEFIKNRSLLAFRFDSCWVQHLEQVDSIASDNIIRAGDTILITGGLGGVALAIASKIASQLIVNFILVSRNDIYLLPKSNYISRQIKLIEQIKSSGSNVDIRCLDIGDDVAVAHLLSELEQQYRTIDGLIHTAGVLPIVNDTYSLHNVWQAFSGKVYGIHNILNFINRQKLRYLATTSSLASIMGDVNRIEYCAANSYLDYVCVNQNLLPNTRLITINWPGWSDTGMAVKNSQQPIIATSIIEQNVVNANEGSEVFYQLLNQSEFRQIAISKLDIQLLLEHLFAPQEDSATESRLAKISEDSYTEIELKIAGVYCEVLATDEISLDDDFFSLGGNSIAAIRLVSRLNQALNANVKVADIFKAGTVRLLADLISHSNEEFAYKNYLMQNTKLDNLYQPFELNNVQQAYYVGRSADFELGNVATHGYSEHKFINLDVQRLELALNKLIERHLGLRTVFIEGKQQYLENYSYYQIKLVEIDNESDFLALRDTLSHKIYAADKFPLFDFIVSKCSFNSDVSYYILHVGLDALLMDENSSQIFFTELTTFYTNPKAQLPMLNINFRDYMQQLNNIRASNLFKQSKDYWQDKLYDYDFEMKLPLACQVQDIQQPHFKRLSRVIPKLVWDKVVAKALAHNIGITVVMMSLYGKVLSYWTNQERVCINLTLFNRLPLHEQINDVIGDFTVLELFNYKGSSNSTQCTITATLKANHDQLWQDIEHSLFDGIDFQRLIREEYQFPANQIIAPVVLTSVLGDNFNLDTFIDKSYLGNSYSITQTSQVWLDNKAYTTSEGFVAQWDYVEQLFARSVIENMHAHYCELIEYLAKANWDSAYFPELRFPDSDLQVIQQANSATQEVSNANLFSYYENYIRLSKQEKNIAVIDNNQHSYGKLIQESLLFAKYLSQFNTVHKLTNPQGCLIGILSEKGYNQVIASLAIMKSGFAYLPLNVDWPLGRIDEVLNSGQVSILLISRTQASTSLVRALGQNYKLVIIEDVLAEISYSSSTFNEIELPIITPDDIAYVIFTSGSTGKPKGVTVSHGGALNTILGVNGEYKLNANDRVLALSELSFDLSVYDIFGLLAVAGTIVFPDQERVKEPKHWLDLIKQHNITIWNSVPQIMQLLFDYASQHDGGLKPLRLILMSGDWIPLNLVKQLANSKLQMVSLGGATEGSIWSIWYEINQVDAKWKSIPYGTAMPNQKMYVLNADGEHCPIGVIGEIHIGGVGVALGYWSDEEKTKAAFIEHSILGRLYKTGDFGKWSQGGYIEFLGRKDHQVKINGYRVELEEIAAKLNRLPGVAETIVKVQSQNRRDYIVGYLLPQEQLSHMHAIEEQESNLESFKLATHGIRTDLANADYNLNIILDAAKFKLRKSYRKYLAHAALNTSLLGAQIEGAETTIYNWFMKDSKNVASKAVDNKFMLELLAQISCVELTDRALPKYLYPSAGSSYAVQAYLNLKQEIGNYAAAYYYYNPLQTSLTKTDNLSKINTNGEFSIDLVVNWPAIEPLYQSEARKFAYLEVGHILALLQQHAEVSGVSTQLELYEECLDQDNSLLARLVFTAQVTVGLSPRAQLNKLLKSKDGVFSDGGLHSVDIKKASIFTQSNWYSGRLLETGQVLLTFDGEASIDNLIYAGMYFQILGDSLYQYNLGSCMLGYEVYDQVLYAMVIGAITKDEKSRSESMASDKPLKHYIEDYIAAQLPEYMLPYEYIVLNKLPLTVNGKVDLKQLPPLNIGSDKVNYVAPQNELETRVCEAFALELGIDVITIGIQDNFFRLGGNSILAIRLVSRLNNSFESNLKVSDVFKHKTVIELSTLIKNTLGDFIFKDYRILEPDLSNLYQPFELNNVQQAYYLGRYASFELGNISTHTYNEYKFRFIDSARLEFALNRLIERHLGLRTIFIDGQQQYLETYPHYPLKVIEFRHEDEFLNLRDSLSHKIYAADKFPLFDVILSYCVFANQEAYYVLHIGFDILLMDGNSTRLFYAELTTLYTNPLADLTPLTISYRDYMLQLTQIRESKLFNQDREYWLNKLPEYSFEYNLPLKCKAADIEQPHFNKISQIIAKDIWNKLEAKALVHNLGLTSIVTTVYGKVLSHWSNQEQVTINLTLFNRLPLHPQINEILGDFTVLELFNFKAKHRCLTILEELKANHAELWQDIEHNLFDGVDFQRMIREELKLESNQILAPIVLTSVLGVETDPDNQVFINDDYIAKHYSSNQTSQVWLLNQAYTTSEGFVAEWDYVEQLFDPVIIQQMHSDYCTLICQLAEIDWELASFPLPKVVDIDLINNINIAVQDPVDSSLCDYVINYISRNSLFDNLAVVDNSAGVAQNYSYAQLLSSSHLMALVILERQIVLETTPLVAILCEKGFKQVVAALGVMQSGHAYLPLHTDWPIGRIDEILHSGEVSLLLVSRVQAQITEIAALGEKYKLIIIDDVLTGLSMDEVSRLRQTPLPKVASDAIAYVIFTSGSTGKPKGVTISHRGALNTLLAVNDANKVSAADRVLALSELSFDLSVYDIFGMLMVGGVIVFPNQEKTKEPRHWLDLVNQYQVSIWNSVPQLAELFIDELGESSSFSLRLFLLSGDWIATTLPDKIRNKCSNSIVVSLGGATEGSIWSIWYKIEQVDSNWTKIPYGVAMPNQSIWVLSHNLELCPVEVLGDIYIGGMGVALNYYKDDARTAASFIQHPYYGRLYKTGDLGRVSYNGYIEFAGRMDNQVKLNGYRVELEEVSAKLGQLNGIAEALAQIVTHVESNYLIAYFIASPDNSFNNLDEAQLKEYFNNQLSYYLPEYMLPYAYVRLDKLPLTPNGKVNFKQLPLPNFAADIDGYVAPRTNLEYSVCQIFANILKRDSATIGVNDNFFRLGGDSIIAIRLISKLNFELRSQLSVKDIFVHKNIAQLSRYISQNSIVYLDGKSFELYQPFSLIQLEHYASHTDMSLIEDIYPAAYLQIGMLFETSLSSYSTYHVVLSNKLKIQFEQTKFLDVWAKLINKHELLRAKFVNSLNTYDCIIYKKIELDYSIYSGCDVNQLIQQERLNDFDYTKAGLFRLIVNINPNDFDVILSFHHAITDGWSVASIMNEFISAYFSKDGVVQGGLGISYAHFVLQEQQAIANLAQTSFWQNYLADITLPKLSWSSNSADQAPDGLHYSQLKIDLYLSNKIHVLTHDLNVSVDSVFLYTYLVTLAQFLNQSDITLGLVVNNRLEQEGGDKLFGLFLNTIPYRFKAGFAEINAGITAVYNEKIKLYDYKHYPYAKIKELFAHDLYQFAFNYTNFQIDDNTLAEANVKDYQRSSIPFVFNVAQGECFSLELTAHANFCGKAYLDYFASYLEHNLKAIFVDSASFTKLSSSDYTTLLDVFNNTSSYYPRDKTLVELFSQQVRQTPDSIALIYKDKQLSYVELEQRAMQLAHYLRDNYNLQGDDLVALCLDRSEYTVIAILAIWMAGAAYVPLDPSYPEDRISYILEDTQAKVILTNQEYERKLHGLRSARVARDGRVEVVIPDAHACVIRDRRVWDPCSNIITIDNTAFQAELSKQPLTALGSNITSSNLAYVIYTSGTTGKPKGVMIEHQSVVNLVTTMIVSHKLQENKIVAVYSNYVFDAFVYELVPALLNGNQVTLLDDDTRMSIDLLSQTIVRHDINILFIPSVLILDFFNSIKQHKSELRMVFCGGDKLPQIDKDTIPHGITLMNEYGPTEATVCATQHHFTQGDLSTNIGKPINNTKVYILGEQLNLLPVGAVGELYIGGSGLARGYLNQEQLSNEKFILNPYQNLLEKQQHENTRLYKTGDLVKYLANGDIQFIGRNDFQVKIRGFRVELAEIEATLIKACPQIEHALVVAHGGGDTSQAQQYLVAYYVSSIELDPEMIRTLLATYLPDYMLPEVFIYLTQFPTNFNGKIDYKALPIPQLVNSSTNYIAPCSEDEKHLSSIWAEILNLEVDKIGLKDDFYRLGGNSILVIRLVAKINEDYHSNLKLADVLIAKTIESILKLIRINNNYQTIVKLNHAMDKPIMLMLHPGQAGCEVYAKLADQLSNSFTCYGIDNYNLHHEDKYLDLNSLTNYYLKTISTTNDLISVDKELVLLGWSLGGLIALELAAILEQQGHTKIKVYLLDTVIYDEQMHKLALASDDNLAKQHLGEFLLSQAYDDSYVDKIVANYDIEMALIKHKICQPLRNTQIILFKAMQISNQFAGEVSEDMIKHILSLQYNNADKIIDDLSRLQVFNLAEAHHWNILDHQSIINTLQST